MKHFLICKSLFLLGSIAFVNSVYGYNYQSDTVNIDSDIVPLAYRDLQKKDIVGSINTVDMKDLRNKSFNTYSLDNLDALVPGWTGNTLWGKTGYMVLVDGIQRDASSVLQSEVSSVTFLKGAEASILYGSAAVDGAILITTKRGSIKDKTISANVNYGMYFAKRHPNFLGSAEYMTYYNQALLNDDKQKQFSDEDIYNYGSGINKYRYPDVDLFSSDYMDKYYSRMDASLEITGGTQKTKYYANIGYIRNDDYLKFGEASKNGSNRLNFRGNLDFTVSNYVSAYINSSVSFNNQRSAIGNYWNAAMNMRPNRISPLIPVDMINQYASDAINSIGSTNNIFENNSFLSGSQIDQTNIFADYLAAGYENNIVRQLQSDLGVNINLGTLLKGLTFNASLSIDYNSGYKSSYNNQYSVYEPIWSDMNGEATIIGLNKYGVDRHSGNQNINNSWTNRLYSGIVKLNYNRSFKEHNLNVLALATANQKILTGQYHKPSNSHLGLLVSYNYNHKYYVDLSSAMIHSPKLPENNRNGWSKSVTLGWNIANESFLENSNIDYLKISTSLSDLKTDIGIDNYYMYEPSFTNTSGGGYFSWADAGGLQCAYSTIGGNPDLTFLSNKEYSVNLNSSFWKNILQVNISAYHSERHGGLIRSDNQFPVYFSNYYPSSSLVPYTNYNVDMRQGFDAAITYNTKINDLKLSVGAVCEYSDSKAKKRDEIYEDVYQRRQGKAIDAMWGLQNEGFFVDEDDIANSCEQKFGTVKPGDIKYKDQNDDGVIDEKDEVVLGKWGSPWSFGANITLKYANFTLFAVGTARIGAKGMKNTSYDWIYGDRKYSDVVRNSWTSETADVATYPRLTTDKSDNNFRSSDFWTYNTNRFDLSKVQLTYDFPSDKLKNKLVKNISAYVAGYNLLTVSSERKRMETNFNGAPYSRFVNIGINATF